MWHARTLLLLTAAAGGMALLAGACFSERADTLSPGSGDCRFTVDVPPGGGHLVVVEIRDFAFHPETVEVPRGATVVWVNCEPESLADQPHTATADGGAFGSPLLAPGESFAHRFEEAGEFPYGCAPHPIMRGTIVVE